MRGLLKQILSVRLRLATNFNRQLTSLPCIAVLRDPRWQVLMAPLYTLSLDDALLKMRCSERQRAADDIPADTCSLKPDLHGCISVPCFQHSICPPIDSMGDPPHLVVALLWWSHAFCAIVAKSSDSNEHVG